MAVIESIAKLAFLYVLTSLFIELAFPAGRRFLKYIYWSAIILTVFIATSPIIPIAKRFLDDVHSVATTYSEGKGIISSILGGPLERITGGNWEVPVKGPITQRYVEGQHHGIDVAAKDGTPIKAAHAGSVKDVSEDPIYGLKVVLSHSGGYESLYAHCSEALVKKGDKVFAGDKIAKVGSTGNSTGFHLHWEVRVNGKTINPKELIE